MQRNPAGVPILKGKSIEDVFYQVGAAHATDRPAQMALMRILGRGRATECLADEQMLLDIDKFFRWLGLFRGADEEVARLDKREKGIIDAYCEGLNSTMASRRRPMPFRVWGYHWEPWQPQDIVVLVRLMAWVGLVSSQVNVERAIVEMVQHGVDGEKLRELLSPHLDGCDFDLLKQVSVVGRLMPAQFEVSRKVGSLAASNNWVVAGSKSASGSTILSNDTHLEVNRLPPVWYEVILELEDNYIMGATVPGLPGIVTGRNRDLAWGITYTEADTTDFFVEDCRDGCYLKDGQWKEFRKIEETIKRKKNDPEKMTLYINEHGLLKGDPNKPGKYLCMAWTAFHASCSDILKAVYDINLGHTVQDGVRAARKFHYPSLNWVFADREGNIGFQMAGLFPKRKKGWSGLYPVAGWKSENDWRGWVSEEDLPSVINPEEGFFSTANQDLSKYGKAGVQNCPMTDHRNRRIRELLGEKDKLTIEDMQAIQLDIFSTKARDFVPLFLKLMPDGATKELLDQWDFKYDPQSTASTAFEEIYRRALLAVFCSGKGSFSPELLNHIVEETSVFLNLESFLNRILLDGKSSWFGDKERDEILKEAFSEMENGSWPAWGERNRMKMVNIFYGGKLPGFFGLDKGPFALPGSTATPRQGTVYRDEGRDTTFCPSYRFMADMGTDEAHSVVPGGPSEKRMSKYYTSELEDWLHGRYKIIKV